MKTPTQTCIEPLEARIAPAAFTITPASVEEGNSGEKFLTFTILNNAPSPTPVTIHYTTSDRTGFNSLDNAFSGQDYVAAAGDITFNAGALSRTFTVKILGDVNFEHDENFNVSVADANDPGTIVASTTGTIRNDDARPTISIDSPTAEEGNDPIHPNMLTFAVRLSGASFETISAMIATANGTALAGNDYTAMSATLTFAPGETEKSFFVPISGDTIPEGDETVLANLTVTSPNTTSTAGSIQGVGAIHTDDARLEILDAQVLEGGPANPGIMTFTVVILGGLPNTQVTMNYATLDGTAISTGPNADYTPTSGLLTFMTDEFGNAPSQNIVVPIVGDVMGESNEAFLIKLTNVSDGVFVSKSIATGRITDEDPTVVLGSPTLTEGNLGTTDSDLNFNVSIDQFPTNSIIQLHYHTTDGTAVSTGAVTAGTLDYVASSNGFITVATDANGHATGIITVKVKGDGVTENNEFFNVVVDGANIKDGAAIPMGTTAAKGTINDNDTTVLTIGDATVVEGDAGQQNAVFVVTLTPGSQSTVTVSYTTINTFGPDAATAGQDYTTKSGTLTFAPGVTAQTIVIPIIGDLTYEGNESFTVKLSGPSSGISIANDTGTGTIQDNDPVPTVSVGPASVYEGNTGENHQLSFEVKLSNPSSKAVTVRVVTADGTAVAGSDYTALTMPNPDPMHAGEFLPYQEITFAPGVTTKTVLIDVAGDANNEADETMSVQLVQVTDSTGATLSPTASAAIGTIRNDEIMVSIDDPVIFTEGAADGTSIVTIRLNQAPVPGASVTVNFVLEGVTAKRNDDIKLHDPAMTSLTFEPGETTKTIVFDVVDDTISEGNETFKVTLASANGAVIPFGNGVGTGTIQDNGDPLPIVKILDAQVTEGDNGTKDMTFTVKLTEAAGQPVTVRVATEDGTAIAGSDYTALYTWDPFGAGQILPYQEITFAAGETEKTVTVKILSDDLDEASETFKVKISDATPIVVIGDAEAVGTITDNDLRALSIADSSAPEGGGTMKFTVSLAKSATQEVTVFYTTVDGTAKAGTDYTGTSGTVTFLPGELTKTIDVPIINDNGTAGPDKTFAVALSNPTNATIADNKANGTILDDESYYTLEAISGPSINEADASNVTFKVTRGGDTSLPGTVTYTTADGTAHTGTGDYQTTSGTLNFAAGQTSKMVSVTVLNDIAHELAEDFLFTLTGSTGGVLRDGNFVVSTLSAKTTILDNDAAPTISIASVSKAEGTPAGNGQLMTDLTFTVSLSAADEARNVTLMYETIDGVGDAGAISFANGARPADFNRILPTLLTIPRGSLSATFVVQVLRDSVAEGDETFTVKLSNPIGDGEIFAPGGDTATGTIKNDDGAPTIFFENGSLTVVEGSEGQVPATFTVKLNKPSEIPVTVNVGLVPQVAGTSGTATLGTDFLNTGVPITLTFAPGETSKTLEYSILGDHGNEPNETFTVTLSNAQNGTFGGSSILQATATIKNDDPAPVLVVQNATIVEGNSGESPNLVFTVMLDNESAENVTVDYTTLDIGAFSSGAAPDYQAVSGTLTFAPGEHTKTISVPIIGDDFKEGNETFSLKLSNPTNAIIPSGQSTAIGTILEDGDSTIGVSIADVKTIEGDSGTKNAAFTISLSAASDVPITVEVSTRNGTAVAGADYNSQSTTLTFAPGEKTKTFNVALKSDTVFEATESLFVELENPTDGAVIRDGEGRATIYNDDFQIVNAQTVRYVDADGDLATVHISKGKLTIGGLNPVLNFSTMNDIGGRTLQMIDFTSHRTAFNHTDLSVTADLQPGFSGSGGTSDGIVNVGFIQGGIALGSLFQIIDSIDFGTVTIEGDLGKIVAGDLAAAGRAVANLNVFSHGALGSGITSITGAPDNFSIFMGGAGRIFVGGDVNGVLESVGGDLGDIESLTIKGALRGGSDSGSGQVFVTGTLVNATIGAIVGGAGTGSGSIVGNFTHDATLTSGARIGKVRVLADIVGNAGATSGRIFAPNIGAVMVDGNLIGGSGDSSGVIQAGIPTSAGSLKSVVIKGDASGGTGANSGEIFASKNLGTVIVHGSLLGGTGTDSGSIVSAGGANSVKVLQNIVGAAGERSGSVQIKKSLTTFQLGSFGSWPNGNLIGGTGTGSGLLSVGSDLIAGGAIHGNIEGGSGWFSGGVTANGVLTKLTIGGDLVGGSTNFTGVTAINASGFVAAVHIGELAIFGDIKSGTKANPSDTVTASGTIRVFGDIGLMKVNNIVGNSDVPVVIAAAGATAAAKDQTIRALTVKGNSTYADIIGGYGTVSVQNPLGSPLNPDAQMGTIKFLDTVEATNIVAGIDAGADQRFGTEDDQVITGGTADNPAVRSRIAAIIINGEVKVNSDAFGVVAQIIGAATVSNTQLPLKPAGPDNFELGTGGTNFFLHEVGLS